ncbi:MAG TPA: hypothetical protein VFC74_10655 [Oscillospiraceae bacterium]|nr:hypothetical protein [Oscillospiraceae bacterium]
MINHKAHWSAIRSNVFAVYETLAKSREPMAYKDMKSGLDEESFFSAVSFLYVRNKIRPVRGGGWEIVK